MTTGRANQHLQGDGLLLDSSASNLFSLVMGSAQPGANMTTSQSARDMFYMNYITGNLTQTLGSPMDTGQSSNTVFAAVARHYNVGDPNDLHMMDTDGLHLRAICSQNHTNCSPGNVYAGMIRLPAEFRPGMTIKVRYKSPAGPFSWAPIWMFSGSEYSPGPGGNPYQGYGTSMSLLQLPGSGHSFEIDLNDNYPRWYNSQPVQTGYQFDYGTPNIYGVTWQTPPHSLYWADGYGYRYHPEGEPRFEELPINWSTGFHDLVLSWQTDNNLFEFVDGKLVSDSYMEYPASTYQDGFDNNATKTLAMHLIIGNQAILVLRRAARTQRKTMEFQTPGRSSFRKFQPGMEILRIHGAISRRRTDAAMLVSSLELLVVLSARKTLFFIGGKQILRCAARARTAVFELLFINLVFDRELGADFGFKVWVVEKRTIRLISDSVSHMYAVCSEHKA